MVLGLCILGLATVTLLLIALVDRPKERPTQLAPIASTSARPEQLVPVTSGAAAPDVTLDPYVMR